MADYKARLEATGEVFTVESNELVLDAAIRQGVKIPFSCRNGTCRTCIYTVGSGTVVQEDPDLCLISPAELAAGRRLLCMSTLRSDCVLVKASSKLSRVAEG
ncbi:2Fe-2S iron-sulfur cluster-binding protein [Paenibacillus sp. N1-5-1-14]|uniref:2Fe-2S iron-sulfur cluster-binding protein n=1 Tax=Paenibacillus radicibacter TaxID=2972488 RepID=UPI002159576C|nr:2Fe-2S iron-sulfur cluster-binding protein [Paenibacillus radicibacter]MCR8643067.1 2Fe-2S iron-sulfur cluster-binding protein [Paenibacillus radicibacter]